MMSESLSNEDEPSDAEDGPSMADLEDARSDVDTAEDDLREANEALEEAQERYRLACQLHEEAEGIVHRGQQDLAAMSDTIAATGPAISPLVDSATGRLQAAYGGALAYADGEAGAINGSGDGHTGSLPVDAAASSWLDWKPTTDGPITPDIIAGRLNIDRATGEALASHFVQIDPTFGRHVERLRSQFATAEGPLDVQRVQHGILRDLGGRFPELLVEKAFENVCANVDTQRTESLDDGRYTRVDLVLEGLKSPVILGRGERLGAPAGGNLAIEVKAGRSDYLWKQRDHMAFQASGHQEVASASATICTRDIKDLSPREEKELRERMRDAGSPILGMLPRKEELDQICIELIRPKMEGNT